MAELRSALQPGGDGHGSLLAFFEGLAHHDYPVCQMARPGAAIETVRSRQFLRHILDWSAALQQVPDPIVPIFGRTSESLLAAWLGAILTGKKPTFISYPSHKVRPEDYKARMRNYKRLFRNTVFVGDEADRSCGEPVLTRPFSASIESQTELAFPGDLPPPDAPLFLQCSSGSTGLQKAVGVTTRQLETQVASYARDIKLCGSSDRIVSWLPLYHDMGLITSFLMPLLTRTPVVFLDTFEWAANPASLLHTIEATKATLCWLPNFAFSFLGKIDKRYDLGSVRSFISCSEPVSQHSVARFIERHRVRPEQLSVCYALAENVFAATQTPIGCPPKALLLDTESFQRRRRCVVGRADPDRASRAAAPEGLASWSTDREGPSQPPTWIASCGVAIDAVTIRIDHQRGEEIGEVLLRGGSTIDAYHGAASPRTDGWFPTGDLGFLYENELYVCGRIKDLIIHNGRNIYPQDLEDVVNQDNAVHAGRTVALGRRDPESDSEKPLVLFEPEHLLTVSGKRTVCAGITQRLEALFDIQADVVAVPRLWLKKTSSGKIARAGNLEQFEATLNRQIHIVGDSHVRMFWAEYFSHRNFYNGIFAHSIGVLYSDNFEQFMPYLERLCADLPPFDVLVIEAGEPECRSIFPAAVDPMDRIEQSVNRYGQFFDRLRALRPGPLAYMTGPPTNPVNIDNTSTVWPVAGEPALRYKLQRIFYERMRNLCRRHSIPFIDVCTPFLSEDGLMNPQMLRDVAHIDMAHQHRFLDSLDQGLGFLDGVPAVASTNSQHWLWDGTYTHYLLLAQEGVRRIVKDIWEPDFEHLVSTGVLDSLAVMEMIAMLDQTFHCDIDLDSISRGDFESLTGIYQRFFMDSSGSTRAPAVRASVNVRATSNQTPHGILAEIASDRLPPSEAARGLRVVFDNLLQDMALEPVDPAMLAWDTSILVLRSAPMPQLATLLDQILSHRRDPALHIMSHAHDEDAIREMAPCDFTFHAYPAPGRYRLDGVPDATLDQLRAVGFGMLLYMNPGTSAELFADIEELFRAIQEHSTVSVGTDGTFARVADIRLCKVAESAFLHVIEWYQLKLESKAPDAVPPPPHDDRAVRTTATAGATSW